MPNADRTVLAAAKNKALIESSEGWPQDVVALVVATILPTALPSWQMPALDTRLRHRDICKHESTVSAQIDSRDSVTNFD